MKKVFFLLLAAILFVACEKPAKEETSQVLRQAVCKMNIESPSKRKAVEIVGDSISVHRLSRYTCSYWGIRVNYGLPPNWVDTALEWRYFYGDQTGFFSRDTLAHTFSFHSDFVVKWAEEHFVDGVYIGVDGTEYLGWLACSENVVFNAVYDTVLKRYRDPYRGSEEDFLVGNNNDNVFDTLGYIPNSIMKKNRAILQNMMDEKRFVDMVDFFKSGAYTIYTCTGEEYRELVRLGIN